MISENPSDFSIIENPINSKCKDGRRVPLGIDLHLFIQLNVYQWREGSGNNGTIFTYNPFFIHPIQTKSIIDSLNETQTPKIPRKHAWYNLPRIFDNKELYLDPSTIKEESTVIFDRDIPDGILFFQYNIIHPENNFMYLIKTTAKEMMQQLSNKHIIIAGSLEQKCKE